MDVLVLFLFLRRFQGLRRRLTQVGSRIQVDNSHFKKSRGDPLPDTSTRDSSGTVACNVAPSPSSFTPPPLLSSRRYPRSVLVSIAL